MQSSHHLFTKKRIIIFFCLINLVLLALVFRIGWIQIIKGEEYIELAQQQQIRDETILAKRGLIYDRNGNELALNVSNYTLWGNPNKIIKSKNKDKIISKLLSILPISENDLGNMLLTKKSNLVKVMSDLDKSTSDKIKAENLDGLWIERNSTRYYPEGNFASHIIGHTTADNRGLSGIELKYDKYLSGLPGRWIRTTDAVGRELPYGYQEYHAPTPGLNVVLTIDEVIQHFVEEAINKALADTKAKRVMGIVMDPRSGDILAMATTPSYDPNNPRTPVDKSLVKNYNILDNEDKQIIWNKMWRNPIISDTYEPGSTFKLITAAAGLEESAVEPNSLFYDKGYIEVSGVKLKCWRYYNPHGEQTFAEAVQNSCNPVFVEVAQRLGLDTYYKYIENFGFINPTGIDLPGESSGIIQPKSQVGPVELGTISYGQGISVTPLQLITAISSIGNSGRLMQPKIVKELVDDSGEIVKRYEPKMLRQILSEKTAKELLLIMESVVSEGSGKNAAIPGYRIGGKTGTADKVINGQYADGKVYSSFVGLAPIDDPKLSVLIIIDEPQGEHFGSLTAAPVVHDILSDTFRYLEIEPKP